MPVEALPGMDFLQLLHDLPESRRFRSAKPIVFRNHDRDIFVSRSYARTGVAIATWHPGIVDKGIGDKGYAVNVEPMTGGFRIPVADMLLQVRNYNAGAFSYGLMRGADVGGPGLYDAISSLLNASVLLRVCNHDAFKGDSATPLEILEAMHRHGR